MTDSAECKDQFSGVTFYLPRITCSRNLHLDLYSCNYNLKENKGPFQHNHDHMAVLQMHTHYHNSLPAELQYLNTDIGEQAQQRAFCRLRP
ncbi:hypothetical protein KIH39_10400 [Telmatocola sphagniphila]|uniref:Uncharacterized protein n=1 Tax=Telmatocola sphagniphila TaxID=1123043 RepID=A0A8E6BAB6_9BACT|nr:hypothetical protein [Telmatocola sphagniphila]QVL34292.1 hypothetical protein KIH39_10400 [Telmatocola sphagniphila]